MTLDLLDLLIVANCFPGVVVPWWVWALGILSSVGGNITMHQLKKKFGIGGLKKFNPGKDPPPSVW